MKEGKEVNNRYWVTDEYYYNHDIYLSDYAYFMRGRFGMKDIGSVNGKINIREIVKV